MVAGAGGPFVPDWVFFFQFALFAGLGGAVQMYLMRKREEREEREKAAPSVDGK